MGFVAIGVPCQLESKMQDTQDGTFERLRFHLAHPLASEDAYADLFQVGGKFAEDIREAASGGRPVALFIPYRKEKEAAKNGSDKDTYYWKVQAVETL